MRILILHEVSYLNKPINEYQEFAERMAGLGHLVTVIDFDELNVSKLLDRRVNRTGAGEIRLISLPNIGVPILKYLYAAWVYRRTLLDLIGLGEIETVFQYSVIVNGLLTIFYSKKYGYKVVYRVLDAYHKLRKNKLDAFILRHAEGYIYRNASEILLTNKKMKAYVQSIGGSVRDCLVLEHGVDTEHFRPMSRDDHLAKTLGIEEVDFVCLFLGTTYEFARLDELSMQLSKITSYIPNFKLLVVGSGPQDAALNKLRDRLDGTLILTGMIFYLDLHRYMSLAKLAINPFEINSITKDIVPIKLLQYQAAGLPVVSTPLPDVVNMYPESISGIVYSKSDSIDDFVNEIIQVGTGGLGDLSRNSREYALKNLSVTKTVENLLRILS